MSSACSCTIRKFAGMLTLATRLGLEEQTFTLLKKQSGCTKFGSWNKLLGTAITTYEAQYYRIAWVALGTHVPGPNGWEKSPNYFYDRAMSRLTAECSNHNLKWFDKAYISPSPVKLPKNIYDRCTSASNEAEAVPATTNTLVDKMLCIGLCNERVDYFGNIDPNYCLSKWDYAGGSFEFCLFRIQIDGTLDEICLTHFPSRLRESTVLHCCIFDYLAVTLQSNFIHFLRDHHISNQTQVKKPLTTDEKNMEVNRLLGWAVSKLKHHYERKYHAKKYWPFRHGSKRKLYHRIQSYQPGQHTHAHAAEI